MPSTLRAYRSVLPLITPGSRDAPYPAYRALRERGPVLLRPFGLWVISRYDDANLLVRHPAVSSANRNKLFEAFFRGQTADIRKTILFSDPPDHTRLRTLVSKAFTPRRIEGVRPRVQEIADRLIDDLPPRFDLLADFSYPLPTTVICELLGIPASDRPLFGGWMRALANRANVQPALLIPGSPTVRKCDQAIRELNAYLLERIKERRAAPGDDLLSAMVAAEEEGSRLDEAELLAMTGLLLVGGFETVANLTANGMLALLRDPGQLDRLRQEPDLIDSAVEELLRYDSPVQMVVRTALEDISVGGATIHRGQLILIVLGAANRDPARFPDPDRLDLGRAPNPHLTFIAGHHFCLGAHLARIELQTVFATLLRRLPDLRLDTPRPAWRHTVALRGLKSLPLARGSVRSYAR